MQLLDSKKVHVVFTRIQEEYLTRKVQFCSVPFFLQNKKGNALPLRDTITAIYSERHNYFVRVSLESSAWSPSR